jgi:S-adenosylmethionine:tRNA ribosyltransferase-isomerase
VSTYDYDLPPDLIAQSGIEPRDAARLLVVRRASGEFSHRTVRELPELLPAGALIVLNETRVWPARLRSRRGRLAVEVVLVRPHGPGGWLALCRPAKRLRPGDRLRVDGGGELGVEGRQGEFVVVSPDTDARALMARAGRVPLPPYIAADLKDPERYQTVFGAAEGSVAAPTASLHLTHELLARLEREFEVRRLVLHVGPGTFQPVRGDPAGHRVDPERFEIPDATAQAVNLARAEGRPVVAVGTTVTRALETVASEAGVVRSGAGETVLFIRPPYRFRVVDVLMTNFHLPQTTLLMLVAAFAGRDLVMRAYAEAIRERYRFYSLGDATLFL